ncbi:hypothetical protein BKP42_25950 [Rhodococcus erythropolis]|nr:hypothetical protein BKP42_25950 [Rhodococcus erythropolis]
MRPHYYVRFSPSAGYLSWRPTLLISSETGLRPFSRWSGLQAYFRSEWRVGWWTWDYVVQEIGPWSLVQRRRSGSGVCVLAGICTSLPAKDFAIHVMEISESGLSCVSSLSTVTADLLFQAVLSAFGS